MSETVLLGRLKLVDPEDKYEITMTYQGDFSKISSGITCVMRIYSPLFSLFPEYHTAVLYRILSCQELMKAERSTCVRHNFLPGILRDYELWLCPEGLVFINPLNINGDVVILRKEKIISKIISKKQKSTMEDVELNRLVIFAHWRKDLQGDSREIVGFKSNLRSDWSENKNEIELIIKTYLRYYLKGIWDFSWCLRPDPKNLGDPDPEFVSFYLTTDQLMDLRKLST